MQNVVQIIAGLQADVQASTTAEKSAVALITGLAMALATALNNAQNAGLTSEQLTEFAAIQTTLEANTAELANAVVTNPVPVAVPPSGSNPPAPNTAP